MAGFLDTLPFVALLGTLCWLLLTGSDTAFLHPRFRRFLIGGALLLAVFMLVTLSGQQRRESGWPLASQVAQAIVLMMPLFFLVAVFDQGLGAHALAGKYTGSELRTLTRLLEKGTDQIGGGDQQSGRSLLEIARRMKQLAGRRVVTEGMVYRPDIMPPNYLTLFRFAIFCCAADAMPVWVFVEMAGVEKFDDETWIRVDGTLQIINFNGTDVPVIRADTIVKAPAPAPGEQYLFF